MGEGGDVVVRSGEEELSGVAAVDCGAEVFGAASPSAFAGAEGGDDAGGEQDRDENQGFDEIAHGFVGSLQGDGWC